MQEQPTKQKKSLGVTVHHDSLHLQNHGSLQLIHTNKSHTAYTSNQFTGSEACPLKLFLGTFILSSNCLSLISQEVHTCRVCVYSMLVLVPTTETHSTVPVTMSQELHLYTLQQISISFYILEEK